MKTWKAKTPLAVAVAFVLLCTVGSLGADPQGRLSADEGTLAVTGVTTPLLQYQGRLTDPGSGNAVSDGTYTIVFRLYTVDSGGTAVWTETKDVVVAGGLFNTVLGDMIPLDQALFNGQELWLGVKVGTDDEATPRQRLLPVAYALSLVPGAAIEADSASAALQVANVGGGEALHTSGPTVVEGDLTVSGSLSGGSHAHSGEDITSGTVAEAYIDSAIARDDEVTATLDAHAGNPEAHHPRYTDDEAWAAVLARDDEPGTTLNADLLDGQDAAAFAATGHDHDGSQITSGVVGEPYIDNALARDDEINDAIVAHGGEPDPHPQYFHLSQNETVTGRPSFNGGSTSIPPFYVDSNYRVSNLNADLLDGYHATQFAFSSHNHDSAYVNVTGDTMTGVLTVPRVDYSSPRTHYFSVASDDFQPRANVDYVNGGGTGGAYVITSGYQSLTAPVHLPHGAVVTQFRVYFDDTSAYDMTVYLSAEYLAGSGYVTMASVNTSGTSGYYNLVDTSISSATINNTLYGYHVRAYSGVWNSDLRIKGAVITYTIDEAP
jgi:hypothetical protein